MQNEVSSVSSVSSVVCWFRPTPSIAKLSPSLNYNLDVRIEPEQQRLAVRGKITLRNDSASPQKNLTLQISSSLDWRSIQLEGKPVQFVSQPYTSDIDHTGALSEAIVTLPQASPAKGHSGIGNWIRGHHSRSMPRG